MTRVFLMHSWRTRWRSLVVLAIMIGLTGAGVMAAIAGARRSASALDRFHDAGQTLDVFVAADVTTPDPPALLEVLDGPLVESTNDLAFLFVDVDAVGVIFAPTSQRGANVERGVLLDGRRADPNEPDEVALSDAAARRLGLHVGDLFEFGSLSPEQAEAFFTAGQEPRSLDGPQLKLRVVGIVRTGFDLNSFGRGTTLTLTTPAFWEKYGTTIGIGSRSHMVRLVDQPGAVDQFTAAIAAAYGGEHLPSINVGHGERTVADSISVVTAALLAMALVIGVAGLLWIGSATARHQSALGPDIDVLLALGTTDSERRALVFLCVLPALVGGVLLAPLVAVALSPLFPVGAARRVDPDPGAHADAIILLAASAAFLAILTFIAAAAAARLVSRGRSTESSLLRVPRLVDRAARSLRPAPGTGVRFALSAPSRSSAPVRPALAGALVGVVGLVAVAVIGASLHRFVAIPDRWGTTWDVALPPTVFAAENANPADEAAGEPDREALVADPEIEAAAIVLYDEQLSINGVEAISMTVDPVKGGIAPTVIEGRAPSADDEIAVGRDTMRDVGVELGTSVTVTSRSQVSEQLRIVGVIAFPTIGEPTAVATGAVLTAKAGDRLLLGAGGNDVGTPYLVVRWASGVDSDAALARRGIDTNTQAGVGFIRPAAPPEVDGLLDVQQFPLLAGGALAALGIIATSHALIVTVRRRRRELGILSALGFASAQRRAVILGQATTITVIALAIGVPIGALIGRVVWSSIATSIGVAGDASFPLALLALGALGFVVVLNTIASFPARTAGRLRIADALRSE
ncbi:MAG: FtsX-like permease family protein [Ilumatobacteraceae bacterium]